MWASNAAAIETAKSAAGSRSTSRVRFTTRSLIKARSPGWRPHTDELRSSPAVGFGNQMRGAGRARPAGNWLLLGVTVLVELGHIGPQIAQFPFVLDAGEDHLGAGYL